MTQQYRYLFSPLKLGPVTIKNRIILGPHCTNHWSEDFLATARAKAYYEERARGGVGMIIIGASPVDETADYCPMTQAGLFKDEVIPGLREIADIAHTYGVKILQQMIHPGTHHFPHRDSDHPPRAPSQIPAIEEPSLIPKELEPEEIVEIEDKFAAAAGRVRKAGFDGVELHGAHGYLLSAFITPLKNKRTDNYGGSLENRFRFLGETIAKVRAAVGTDFVLGVRISVDDMCPGGVEIDEGVRVARMIEATGKVDYINVSLGIYHSLHIASPTHYLGLKPGFMEEFSRKVKAEVKSIPVFQVGRINNPDLGERLIADGAADAVVMVRELIAEPHFAQKALEGRADEIRPCMYCNEKCIAHLFMPGTHVECNANPAAGEEYRLGSWTLSPAAHRKKVLIIGAGPGGLECARTAAMRGHDVVVYEKGDLVGGQMQLMCRLPGHAEPKDFLDWLERQVRTSGVRIKLRSPVGAQNIDEIIAREKPDATVVAAGARAARDGRSGLTTEPIPGWDRPNVLTYEQVLDGAANTVGKKVLLVDELGDRIGTGIAEKLASQGKEVEVVTRWPNLAHFWSAAWQEMPLIFAKMDELHVNIQPMSWVKEITDSGVTCFNIFSGREWTTTPDTVILVTMKYSNTELYKELKAKGIKPLYLIGDAKAPRAIGEAVRDGHLVAREI